MIRRTIFLIKRIAANEKNSAYNRNPVSLLFLLSSLLMILKLKLALINVYIERSIKKAPLRA